jgi:PadR family transcriptional regulator, regulatory protein PadR
MITLSDCPCNGGTLDKLVQPAILAALTEGPLHGYRLAERIGQTGAVYGGTPDISGVYRFLKKMEAAGLVVSTWEAGSTGHAKRLYEITTSGRTCLARWASTLEAYLESISNLLSETKAALLRRPECCKTVAKQLKSSVMMTCDKGMIDPDRAEDIASMPAADLVQLGGTRLTGILPSVLDSGLAAANTGADPILADIRRQAPSVLNSGMVASFGSGCDRIDSLDLKVRLLTEGIFVHEEVYRNFGRTHHISPDPLECSVLFLPDGTVVHVANVGPAAPFHLTVGPQGDLCLWCEGSCLAGVSLPKATGFYEQRTARGVSFRGLAVLQGHDVLAFPYLWTCEFAKAGQACKFCHCGHHTQHQNAIGVLDESTFTPLDVAEVVDYAVNVERCARYIQLTGGSTLQASGEYGRVLDILQAIDNVAGLANIPGEILVYITPPVVASETDALFAAGADRIACNMEIWNEELFRQICPGKAHWTGRQRTLDTLLHIARTNGSHKACSTFVVGLEPAEDFLAGAEFLARNGIVPIPSIWMPHGLPPVPSPVRADLAFFRKVARGLAEIYDKYDCPPPGELGFNVCLCRDTWNHRAAILSPARSWPEPTLTTS